MRRRGNPQTIYLSPALVNRLSQWHSGMDAIYSLSSTAYAGHPVSPEMIEKALVLLAKDARGLQVRINEYRKRRELKYLRQAQADMHHLLTTITQLENVLKRASR